MAALTPSTKPKPSLRPLTRIPKKSVNPANNAKVPSKIEAQKDTFRKSLHTKSSIPSTVLSSGLSELGDHEFSSIPIKSHSAATNSSLPTSVFTSVTSSHPKSKMPDPTSSEPGRKAVRTEKPRRLTKELRQFIHSVEVKYQIVDSDKIEKRFNNFDGVFWRDRMLNYFRGQPNWPPKTWLTFFWTKGYYKDWADKRRDNYNFWTEHKESQKHKEEEKTLNNDKDSEDEETKNENLQMIRIKAARELGLREGDDWESYESVSDDGKVTKKYRRKSMKFREPELYRSHYARKAAREEQKRKNKSAKLDKTESKIHIKNPLFVKDLISLGSNVESMNEMDISKYLKTQVDNPSESESIPIQQPEVRKKARPKPKLPVAVGPIVKDPV